MKNFALSRTFRCALMASILVFCFQALNAQFRVTGRVTYQSDSSPVYGATILEAGTRNGTATGSDGRYALTVNDRNAVLVFNFTMGIPQEKILVDGRAVIDLVLRDLPKTLTKREKRQMKRTAKRKYH